MRAILALGYLGQRVVILPDEGIVAVRQIRRASHESPADGFNEFAQMVRALAL